MEGFNDTEFQSGNADNAVDDVLGDLVAQTKSASRVVTKKFQNESFAGALGVVLSGPFLIELLGKGLNKAEDFFNKNRGDQVTVGDYLIKFSHKAHHALEAPLKLLAKTVTDDPRKQRLFAETIINGAILILLAKSGLKAALYLSKLKLTPAGLKLAKTAVKGAEVAPNVKRLANVIKRELKDVPNQDKYINNPVK